MLDCRDGVEMLGIDGSDDIHKYAMVSLCGCCSFFTRELIVALEGRVDDLRLVTLG